MSSSLRRSGVKLLSLILSVLFLLMLINACNETTDPTPSIEPPTNLTITAQEGAILLTWEDNSDNESGFAILRKTTISTAQTGEGFEQIATTDPDTDNHLDENVNPTQSYQYQVDALDDEGNLAGDPTLPTNLVSTANLDRLLIMSLLISFKYIINSVGPNTEP